jgi:pantoate--beta-alanine ligase
MRRAVDDGCSPVISIFVNPTQFGPNEDYDKYPRTLDADLALCKDAGVCIVFAPSVAEMYPNGDATRVRVSGITDGLCGSSRPNHFDGVATVVTKLLTAIGPCSAYFGRKDYQQFRVVSQMVSDLLMPVSVVGCTTVREADGLALSSRNRYLSVDERARALCIPRALAAAQRAFAAGDRSPSSLLDKVRATLAASDLREDYVALREPLGLAPLEQAECLPERVLLAVAAYAGATRLIDNLVLGEEAAPRLRTEAA